MLGFHKLNLSQGLWWYALQEEAVGGAGAGWERGSEQGGGFTFPVRGEGGTAEA